MLKTKKNKKSKSSIIPERRNKSINSEIETEVMKIPELPQGSFETPQKKYMPSLPKSFKNLSNRSIEIENRKPQAVIELLGEILGIADYESNIAAFWFLDTLAFHVLKYSTDFDGHHRSIFVSWLAGTMKMIQERNLSREAYLNEMNELFRNTSSKIASGEALLHWEVMFPKQSQEDPSNKVEGVIKRGSSSRSIKKTNRLRKSSNLSNEEKINPDQLKNSEEIQDTASQSVTPKWDANKVLDAIISATNEMFGSISRYALIQAAFVDPVEIHTYVLPYTLGEPQKIKQPDLNDKMETDINRKLSGLKKTEDSKDKEKARTKKTGKSKKKKSIAIVAPPPPSMIE